MTVDGSAATMIRYVRPEEYDVVGELTVRAFLHGVCDAR